MATHNTLDALLEGTVSGFIAYVDRSQPQLNASAARSEVRRMLRVIGWIADAIADWLDDVFRGEK